MKKLSKIMLGAFLILTLGLVCFSFNVLAGTTSTGNVTIANSPSKVGVVTLFNANGEAAAITLQAGSTIVVSANATITDYDEGTDISSANATLYHESSTLEAADDENKHITNSSCALSEADGDTKVVTCTFTMNFMALEGTWTVSITSIDSAEHASSNTTTNTVNPLLGIDVISATVDFGSIELGANSSEATEMTIRSQGNVVLDAQFSGDDYDCTNGEIPVENTRYSAVEDGSYDDMTVNLDETPTTDEGLDLGIRGVVGDDGENSDDTEYFTIAVPYEDGLGGTCTNTLTVAAIANA
jgi:hypothetical protein